MEYAFTTPTSFPAPAAPGAPQAAADEGGGWMVPPDQLDVSDYIALDLIEGTYLMAAAGQYCSHDAAASGERTGESSVAGKVTQSGAVSRHGGAEEAQVEARRYEFRTRSEAIEVLDDGYKWRKYGKKAVKSSPYPRNYYRCSARGCFVKKRVERDPADCSFVLTTYEGRHCHRAPGDTSPSPSTAPAPAGSAL